MLKIRKTMLTTTAVAVLVPALLAPAPAPAAGPDYGPNTCLGGYVWREAYAGDVVCVTPATRAQARSDNAAAASRIDPYGPYGPRTCKSGWVWREAQASDLVCVLPATRTQAKNDNAAAASRRNSVLVTLSSWQDTHCEEDWCTSDGLDWRRVIVRNVNVGSVALGLYRPGRRKPILSWHEPAAPVAGRPGGTAVFLTDLPACEGLRNAYFRAWDPVSERRSDRIWIDADCKTL